MSKEGDETQRIQAINSMISRLGQEGFRVKDKTGNPTAEAIVLKAKAIEFLKDSAKDKDPTEALKVFEAEVKKEAPALNGLKSFVRNTLRNYVILRTRINFALNINNGTYRLGGVLRGVVDANRLNLPDKKGLDKAAEKAKEKEKEQAANKAKEQALAAQSKPLQSQALASEGPNNGVSAVKNSPDLPAKTPLAPLAQANSPQPQQSANSATPAGVQAAQSASSSNGAQPSSVAAAAAGAQSSTAVAAAGVAGGESVTAEKKGALKILGAANDLQDLMNAMVNEKPITKTTPVQSKSTPAADPVAPAAGGGDLGSETEGRRELSRQEKIENNKATMAGFQKASQENKQKQEVSPTPSGPTVGIVNNEIAQTDIESIKRGGLQGQRVKFAEVWSASGKEEGVYGVYNKGVLILKDNVSGIKVAPEVYQNNEVVELLKEEQDKPVARVYIKNGVIGDDKVRMLKMFPGQKVEFYDPVRKIAVVGQVNPDGSDVAIDQKSAAKDFVKVDIYRKFVVNEGQKLQEKDLSLINDAKGEDGKNNKVKLIDSSNPKLFVYAIYDQNKRNYIFEDSKGNKKELRTEEAKKFSIKGMLGEIEKEGQGKAKEAKNGSKTQGQANKQQPQQKQQSRSHNPNVPPTDGVSTSPQDIPKVKDTQKQHGCLSENDKSAIRDLQNVPWKEGDAGVKKATIQRKTEKEPVLDLTEKTINATMADGTKVTCRNINFPPQLANGAKGPVHVLMALKDENGKNMPKNEAIYFSAHYNKEGELVELRPKRPDCEVNFSNDNKIAYIELKDEKGGKKRYTLPVNKETYNAMEVAVKVNKMKVKSAVLATNPYPPNNSKTGPNSQGRY